MEDGEGVEGEIVEGRDQRRSRRVEEVRWDMQGGD